MNKELLLKAYNARYPAPKGCKDHKSLISMLEKWNVTQYITDPPVFAVELKKHTPAASSYDSRVKQLRNLLGSFTPEDKVAVVDALFDSRGDNPVWIAYKNAHDDRKVAYFDVNIERPFQYLVCGHIKKAQANISQKPSASQVAKYRPYDELLPLVTKEVTSYTDDDLLDANKLYNYQFAVLALIFLCADHNLRLDAGFATVEKVNELDPFLVENGIYVPKPRKTKKEKESDFRSKPVMLGFGDDELLKKSVLRLRDARIRRKDINLFCLLNGGVSKDHGTWLSNQFGSKMSQVLGHKTDMNSFRKAYGIKLTKDNKDRLDNLEVIKMIERKMNHSFETHLREYNLKFEEAEDQNGPVAMDVDAPVDAPIEVDRSSWPMCQ
jgi:hypothetical protein